MDIKIEYLADNKELISDIALLNHENWSHLAPNRTYEELYERMKSRVNKKQMPFHIVAKINNKAAGGAILLERKDKNFPQANFWIGSVAVKKVFQNNGIASTLVLELINIAKSKSIKTLYLETEQLDGGLYKKLGFIFVKEIISYGDKVIIMKKDL